MTQEQKHTDLPFSMKKMQNPLTTERYIKIKGADKQTTVAIISFGKDNEQEQTANAELFCRAASCHYDLLEAAQDRLADIKAAQQWTDNPDVIENLEIKARKLEAAIAKAEGK